MRTTCPARLILLDLITLKYTMTRTSYEAPHYAVLYNLLPLPPLLRQKCRVVPVLNLAPFHEGVLGSAVIAPRILDLGTRWKLVVSFTPQPLSPSYPLDRRLCGPQSRSERGEEKNSQPLPELEPPIIQLVSQRSTTELSGYYFPPLRSTYSPQHPVLRQPQSMFFPLGHRPCFTRT
jgi:hypothetical protein